MKKNFDLVLLDLNIQNVRPPTEVKDAFDDASKALQDKSRLEEDARADGRSVGVYEVR